MHKRLFDIIFSLLGLVFLLPLFIIISIAILVNDGFPIFYLQKRIGLNLKPFKLFKFRSMYNNAAEKGLLTVGNKDRRITKIGYFIRKYKIDELPQLMNVLIGNMSLVGPRPEVKKYVDLYDAQQQKVLSVKPGITDYASIVYRNENEILANSNEPEKTYINEVMPHKLSLNLKYINEQSLMTDIKIIFNTLKKIIQ
jgi:lipopolysaccharide/colanic/teichoic acid biosynthesis glycosyltransferase